MRIRRIERAALLTFFVGACAAFFGACLAISYAHAASLPDAGSASPPFLRLAQNTLPQAPEVPVSPTTPGTLPGTLAGPGTAIGTNPITGQPCLGGGSSAINGGLPGAATIGGQPAQPGNETTGLPPDSSVYGLNNRLGTATPGAC